MDSIVKVRDGLYSEAIVLDHGGKGGTYKSQGVPVQCLVVTFHQQLISLFRVKHEG